VTTMTGGGLGASRAACTNQVEAVALEVGSPSWSRAKSPLGLTGFLRRPLAYDGVVNLRPFLSPTEWLVTALSDPSRARAV